MKIYIDNIVLHFNEAPDQEIPKELSTGDIFQKLNDDSCECYVVNKLQKNSFFDELVSLLNNRPERTVHLYIPNADFNPYDEITERYSPEPAAGGFVRKGEEFLMIKRLGKWDLPKGKIEKGEDSEEAALREVKEECGVIAESKGFLCDTHHMYIRKGKVYIKRTSWYLMENLDDSGMKGQEEEGITEVNWYNRKMLETNLIHSYGNIEDVFLNFLREKEKTKVDTEGTH